MVDAYLASLVPQETTDFTVADDEPLGSLVRAEGRVTGNVTVISRTPWGYLCLASRGGAPQEFYPLWAWTLRELVDLRWPNASPEVFGVLTTMLSAEHSIPWKDGVESFLGPIPRLDLDAATDEELQRLCSEAAHPTQRSMARHLACARKLRREGLLTTAIEEEALAEACYRRLPKYLRWW